jgi:hypothetical protein
MVTALVVWSLLGHDPQVIAEMGPSSRNLIGPCVME